MKVFSARFSLAQSLVALLVSFALVLSAPIVSFASPAKSSSPVRSGAPQADALQSELQLTSATATETPGGVLLRWSTNSTPDNVGFNVYRVKDGQRTRVNRNIIPGAMFGPGTPALMRGGYSYAWFDRGGTANSSYVIESVKVDGSAKTHQALTAVPGKTAPGLEQMPESLTGPSTPETDGILEKHFPAAENQLSSPQGAIEEQWAIAGQAALKIGIKKDGWYRVTQPQMVAAGFNPTVDIRNLRLFVEGVEVAIATNQLMGTFRSGDYIEFYGRGVDTSTTDTRVYYLVAGTTPGKRVTGEIQLDSPPVDPPPPPPVPPAPTSTPPVATTLTGSAPVLLNPIFYSYRANVSANISSLLSTNPNGTEAQRQSIPDQPATANSAAYQTTPNYSQPESNQPVERPATNADDVESNRTLVETDDKSVKKLAMPETRPLLSVPVPTRSAGAVPVTPGRKAVKSRKSKGARKKSKRKPQRQFRKEYSHAVVADSFAATNFAYTYQIKDRIHHLSNLINGEEENFFGNIISTTPLTLPLPLPNPDSGAGPATLEFALQGVLNTFTNASHQVSVAFNDVTLGVVDFLPLDHPVRTFSIPAAQILNGANTIKFTKTSTGEVCLVDYVRMTYAHAYKADSGSLKFSLLGIQTRTVDGFSGPSVRLIDYSDPLAVKITRPASQPTALGHAITVPASDSDPKNQRLFLAIPNGQFDQPASLTVNQPSTLNLNSNAASFVIISYKDFIPSFTTNVSPINTSLVAQRQSQGHTVKIVDIEDVYDEFSFGSHGPQAIKNFLEHASTHWATPPQYVIFAGDASLDPRNYTGSGNFDLVPTKLVDATYNETCSDDWLADFDDDGIANIPVGRLPFRTVAEASLILSKIVNFTPVNPQSALLVADFQGTYYYSFTGANDEVQALLAQLVPAMTVSRINRPDASTNVEPNVVSKINEGQAMVAYSGHGNVDVWSGSFTAAGATGLTNGNELPFVVVMDCLNGYYQDPVLLSLSEALLRAQNGGAVASFASSGLTLPDGQHQMSLQLFSLLYGAQPIALGDAIKTAKSATVDFDVRRTWVFFGDPSMKIR